MSELPKNDPRITEILNQLERFSSGDFEGRLSHSDTDDEVESVRRVLNRLGDRLQHRDQAARGKELKLKESEQQIQTIFRNAPDAVVVIDSNDVILRWNPAATKIFGWQEEEVVGKLLHQILIPERYREKHLNGLRRFLKTGQGTLLNSTVELPALCKNNSEISTELTVSLAQVNDQYLFIAFLRDISERAKTAERIREFNASLEQRVLERTHQLEVSELKYRYLFQNNPMALWVLDTRTLAFIDVNESALKTYGYSRGEFLSMTSVELRPEEERARYQNLDRTRTGTHNTGIWKHRKKDGTIIHAEVVVHEIEFEGKSARLVLANDVTDKVNALRELQLSEARFRRIFNSRMIGLLIWDEQGRITDCNDFFLEMLGYDRSDVAEGRIQLEDITAPEYSKAEKVAWSQIEATGVCEPYEKVYIKKDGSRIPVLIGRADISDSPSVQGVTFVMDISQRKKMEQEILELNRDLEVRIAQRTHALQEVNKELESFTYSVSHDLRAPLRAIHGYAEMLAEDYQPKLDPEGTRLLESVKFNARRMGRLVDDLLAFSRMGKVVLTEMQTDVTALVKDLVRELVGESNRTSVTVHPLGSARADHTLLRQVFHNLISNAVKYSSRKPDPMIEIGVTALDGECVWYVKDNGAGFDMTYYKKLFGVFERLHEQEEFEGTGVGLAIVQRIIHRHCGKVWAEGRVGEGATFYFTLGEPPKG